MEKEAYVDQVKSFTQISKAKEYSARLTVNHVKETHRLDIVIQKLKHKTELGNLRVDLVTSKLTIGSRDNKIKRLEY